MELVSSYIPMAEALRLAFTKFLNGVPLLQKFLQPHVRALLNEIAPDIN
jgi:hypothetical protein